MHVTSSFGRIFSYRPSYPRPKPFTREHLQGLVMIGPPAIPSRGRATVTRLLTAVALVVSACGADAPRAVALRELAARQEAYEGQRVRTCGTVVGVVDAAGAEQYYVLEDEGQHRVRLLPDDQARRHERERVAVVGSFRFEPAEGRVLQIDELERGGSCEERWHREEHRERAQRQQQRRAATASLGATSSSAAAPITPTTSICFDHDRDRRDDLPALSGCSRPWGAATR
jgi:hypothetical protein